ncbi:MAG: hypothetical protein L6R40_002362 [Gallowayella cf. fulva]|nr:MAG: hypothetical protein L6R40_002362 [Xanthomendoza cf. fulva]
MAAAMAASFALSVLAIPTILISKTLNLQPRAAESESYLCPDPAGFAAAKQALIGFGARPVDIAIAMLESGCAFTATYAAGNGKQAISSDAAELGVYHHNWYMLRTYYPGFQGAAEGDWFTRGQELHNDVGIATTCQREMFDLLGPDKFYAFHRASKTRGRTRIWPIRPPVPRFQSDPHE